jgi:hypothetical protein
MKRLLLQASAVGLAVMTPAVAGAYSRRLCKKTAFPFFARLQYPESQLADTLATYRPS